MPRTLHEVYVVRHAIAYPRGRSWPNDAKRPLTRQGAARFKRVARTMRKLSVEIDLVLTSPLKRARQTADLLAAGLRPSPEVVIVDALAPGHAIRAVALAVAKYWPSGRIAIVGHEPGLGELAAWLIGSRAPLEFKKGGVCRIDFSGKLRAGAGRLVWFAPPKLLL